MPSAPAPTWRTHDWCGTCGSALNREIVGGLARIMRHVDFGHEVVMDPADASTVPTRYTSRYTPAQRAAFEAWARG